MTSGGVDAFKAAVRRSLPLMLGLILLGVAAVNVFEQVRGPRYAASARLLISSTPLSSIITGTQPTFVDPQRVQQNALGIAGSPQLYALAARQTSGKLGGGHALQSATSVTGDANSDLITFTASSSHAKKAVGIVNAVTRAYIDFSARLSGSQITSTINQLRLSLAAAAPHSAASAGLRAQLNRLEVLQSVSSSDAELVQQATSASRTSPAPVKDSLLGFAIGLAIALVAVALREAIDTTVRGEADVEDLLSVPVLASMRSLPRRARMVSYGRHEAHFGDNYALLATQIAHASSGGGGILAVTSALPEEGKTTTVANLAIAMARRGARVLAADLDFRKPGLSRLLELPPGEPGALQVMSASASLEDVLWSVSLDGPGPRLSQNGTAARSEQPEETEENGRGRGLGSLYVLPSGGTIAGRRIPQKSRMGALIDQLRGRWDLVILDTPPALLTPEVADLSEFVDMVVVVVRQGRVTQRSLRTLRGQARAWSAEVTGAVVTDVPAPRSYAYYGGR
jgi:Mrp family chromosome partitioning ATPase